jgi:DNA-binding response OmpR family regulator
MKDAERGQTALPKPFLPIHRMVIHFPFVYRIVRMSPTMSCMIAVPDLLSHPHSSYASTLKQIEWPSKSGESRHAIHLRRYGSAQMYMASPGRGRKRILMVEDHEDAWEMVELKLQEYKLTFARDFDDGLRLARRRYFDIYILDNWLPSGSGIGLCRLIREFDPHTPILFYSAAAYQRDIEEAMRSGAQACLVKPVNLDDLEQAVAKLTSPVGGRDSEAWRAEIAAVREELAVRYMEDVGRMESAKEKRLRAEEKLMRLKAEKAFLDAGGTRGEFARRWPSVFKEEVRSRRS